MKKAIAVIGIKLVKITSYNSPIQNENNKLFL